MKCSSSRWAFSLGFVVGACSVYIFLRQVWFERSYPILSEAQEKASQAQRQSPSIWKKDAVTPINLLHPQHTGASSHHVV